MLEQMTLNLLFGVRIRTQKFHIFEQVERANIHKIRC